MDIYLFFALFIAVGVLSAVGLARLRRKLPFGRYNWPLCFFLAVLGAAANNSAAVFFAGGDAFLPSGGGFLGSGSWTALITGLFLALFAVPGILTSLFFLQRPAEAGPAAGISSPRGQSPAPCSCWACGPIMMPFLWRFMCR